MSHKGTSYRKLLKLGQLYLFLLLVFFGFRVFFTVQFTENIHLHLSISDFFKLLLASFRFDTVVIFYALIPLFLWFFVLSFLPKKNNPKAHKYYLIFFKIYSFSVVLLLIVITIFDFFFFKTYTKHFSPLIFGLKDDGTSAILVSIWTDYPIVKMFLVIFIFGYITYKIILRIHHSKPKFKIQHTVFKIVFSVFIIALYFLGMRGSLGLFPINLTQASVTENQLMNQISINSVFALKETLSQGSEINHIHTDTQKELLNNGFSNIEKPLKIYLGNAYQADKPIEQIYHFETPYNEFLEKNPPHIVLIVMESFSKQMVDLNSSKFNILGTLPEHWSDFKIFKNMLSGENLTIYSLENLITSTPFRSISQSKYQDIALKTSSILPFKKSHYQTTFIYGGEYAWRNIGGFMKTQGFDRIITRENLIKNHPNAYEFAWGLHDEYLYEDIFSLLEQSKTPQLIMTMTLSNHTPFQLPPTYHQKPIEVPREILDQMRSGDEVARRGFIAFQYAAEQLSIFIQKLKASALAKNTILVITGDHNLHNGFIYNDSNRFNEHSVPIAFYVPKKYLPKSYINLQTFGSHKDIFPTLYHLALSEQSYFKSGENLFSNHSHFSINAYNFAADTTGLISLTPQSKFYKWKDTTYTELLKVDSSNHFLELYQKLKAQKAVHSYFVQKALVKKQP